MAQPTASGRGLCALQLGGIPAGVGFGNCRGCYFGRWGVLGGGETGGRRAVAVTPAGFPACLAPTPRSDLELQIPVQPCRLDRINLKDAVGS